LVGLLTALLSFLASFLCVLPGIYLKVAWTFSLALVADKRLEFWSAMELSRKVATRHWFKILGLFIVAFAPYIMFNIYLFLKTMSLTYSVIGTGAPDFATLWQAMKKVTMATASLTLIGQVVLLLNLPFALAALLYAYEDLFGPRPAPAA